MHFTIENRFPAPPDVVAEALLDTELQEEIHHELGYEEWDEVERVEEEDGRLLRTLDITPKVDLPGFVRSALGDSAGYREHQSWAPDRLSYRWWVEFELSRLITLEGTCRLEPEDLPDGEEGTVRIIDADCTVSVPLLGGKLAAYVRDETIRTQTAAAEVLAACFVEDEEEEEDGQAP